MIARNWTFFILKLLINCYKGIEFSKGAEKLWKTWRLPIYTSTQDDKGSSEVAQLVEIQVPRLHAPGPFHASSQRNAQSTLASEQITNHYRT
jgi:hypothetical protein